MLTTANLNTLSCKTEGNNMIKKEIKLESYQSWDGRWSIINHHVQITKWFDSKTQAWVECVNKGVAIATSACQRLDRENRVNPRDECGHYEVSTMTYPGGEAGELCRACLMTRYDCGGGGWFTSWQDHCYQSIADWYFEAGVRQREIDQK